MKARGRSCLTAFWGIKQLSSYVPWLLCLVVGTPRLVGAANDALTPNNSLEVRLLSENAGTRYQALTQLAAADRANQRAVIAPLIQAFESGERTFLSEQRMVWAAAALRVVARDPGLQADLVPPL